MLHTDLIAPIPELLRRHASGARGQDRLSRRAFVGHLCGTARPHGPACRASRGHRYRAETTQSRSCCRIRCNGSKPASALPVRGRDRRADQLRCDRAGDRLSPGRRELPGRLHHRRARRPVREAAKATRPISRPSSSPIAASSSAEALRLPRLDRQSGEFSAARSAARCTSRPTSSTRPAPPAAPRASAHCARHAVDRRRLLGADHRPWRARHGAVAAAAVPFLCAQSFGARRSSRPARANTSWRASRPARRCGCSRPANSPISPACRPCFTICCRRLRTRKI